MARRSAARWIAPLALLVSVAAVLIVLSTSGGETSSGDDSPTTTASSSTTSTSTGEAEPVSDGPRFYTVQPGDVLSAIADKTGVPLEQIESLNDDVDAQALVVGQRIRLRP